MRIKTADLRPWMRAITLCLGMLLVGYARGYASDSTKNAPSGWKPTNSPPTTRQM
ncbi:MAG: hypothetical protein ACKOX4_12055 [Bacteroidota bacterium]